MKLRIVLKKSRICTVGTWPHTRPAISETLQYFEGGAWHDVMVVSEEEANKDRSPEQAADELSALSQEMGLYDDPEKNDANRRRISKSENCNIRAAAKKGLPRGYTGRLRTGRF